MEITLEVLYQGQQKIENALYGLKPEVDGFKQEVGGLKQEVGGLKQAVGGLKQEVGGLKQAVGGLKQAVDELKQEIINSNLKITQWAVGLFIGTIVILTSVIGVYTALITFAIQ